MAAAVVRATTKAKTLVGEGLAGAMVVADEEMAAAEPSR
jgi:hypothetical protein